MIARWMLGALLFSALCGIAALAAERGLRVLRMPTRMSWALALAIAACWPVVAPLVLTPVPHDPGVFAPSSDSARYPRSLPTETAVVLPSILARWYERLDPTLLVLWSATSALLLVQVVLALRTLYRVRRRARVAQVDGEHVLVDQSLGPAVIGLLKPTIVIPSWLLEFDHALRALVLRHEREHCRARDPAMVWLSVATTTMLPWNLPLWWMARRLRIAMEIDCDARTLRGSGDRTQYARLLVLIAQHHASARFVPLLSNSSSHLRRRISAMYHSPVRYPGIRAAIALSVAMLAVAGACSSRIASNLTSPSPVVAESAAPVAIPTIDTPTPVVPPYFDFQVDTPAAMAPGSVGPRYPTAQRAAGVAGTVLVQFVVNTDGSVDPASIKVLVASDSAFAAAVRVSLAVVRYSPARKGGAAVRQLVQQPFGFYPADDTAVLAMPRRIVTAPPTPRPKAPVDSATSLLKPYFDFQVEQPVVMRSGTVGPEYPQALRDAKIQGQVLAQFVVDADGKADLRTFKVLKSDHDLFSDAVRAALVEMQFSPAMLKGTRVMQLVQQPFQFSLNRD